MQSNFSLSFSETFWKTRQDEGSYFDVQEKDNVWTISFSDQPKNADKVPELFERFKQLGAIQVVKKSLETASFRFVPDTFLHNLSRLFQTVVQEMSFLDEVAFHLIDQLQTKAHDSSITYEEYLEAVDPDLTLAVKGEEGEVEFPVHRSMLSYYSYWRAMVSGGLKESGESRIVLKDITPATLSVVIRWLYTGTIQWPATPPKDADQMTIKLYVLDSISSMLSVRKAADGYLLQDLVEQCELNLKRLSRLLSDTDGAESFYEVKNPPLSFSTPADDSFYDVTFVRGSTRIQGNKGVLATRSVFLHELFQKQKEKEILIPEGLSGQLFKDWIAQILAGRYISPRLMPSHQNDILRPNKEDLFALLKLSAIEGDCNTQRECAKDVVRYGLSVELTASFVPFFDHLELRGPKEHWAPLFADTRLKIRSLRIHPQSIDKQELIDWLKVRGPTLHNLDMSDCSWVDDELLEAIGETCPSLSTFVSYNIGYTDRGIIALTKKCRELHSLSLYEDKHDYDGITDRSLKAIAENLSELQELVLYGHGAITSEGGKLIEENCEKLTLLHIADCAGDAVRMAASYPQLRALTATFMEDCSVWVLNLASRCRKLCQLTLHDHARNGNYDTDEAQGFSEGAVIKVIEKCHDLHTLDLEGLESGEALFETVAVECPNLRKLRICRLNVSQAALDTVTKKLRQLRTLEIAYTTSDLDIGKIAASLPHLQHLEYLVGESKSAAFLFQIASCCPDLRSLVLHSMGRGGVSGVIQVLERCRQLESLTLDGRDFIDSDLEKIVQTISRTPNTRLRAITLRLCSKEGIASFKAQVASLFIDVNR